MPKELIRLENICKTYHLGEVDVPVLRGISLSIGRGELVALMGASGSGKTTLMNILGCLDHPTSGKYWLDGDEMSQLSSDERAIVRTEKLGFVFQNFNLLSRTTAIQNVIMPLDYSLHPLSSSDAKGRARELLTRVGLAERVEHEPSQMSGGQQQRVAIGRSLINRPALILADEPTGNLDSHTSVEILRMFQELNREGITVVLVTHDPKVAAFAHRVIRIADGQVESDDATGPEHTEVVWADPACDVGEQPEKDNAETPTESIAAAAFETPHRTSRLPMLVPHTLRTAFGALKRNKMRSALSALGVIIAVSAVIAMIEIGEGSKTAMQKTIASMGANIVLVLPGAALSGGVTFGAGSQQTLTPGDMEQIAKQCPAVACVAPVVRSRGQVVYGHRNWNTNAITGSTPAYLTVRDWEDLEDGNIFTDRDVQNRSKVCVIGTTLKRELFQNESPVGKDIRIQNVTFRVIGVLRRKGANMVGQDQDDIIVAPWTTVKFLVSGISANAVTAASATSSLDQVNSVSNLYPGGMPLYLTPTTTELANTPQPIRFVTVDQMMVKAASGEQISQAMEEISELLRERHRIDPGEEDDFNLRDMTELTRTLTATSALMRVLLLTVAAISLVVGGVGIMNIMLVSVTERTREIGLRMAVGARGYHILRQFLIEAIVLCLCGGAIGILFGQGISGIVRWLLRWPTETSMPAVIAAVAVSATVGIVFGFYPAWKASRLDPIEALRYE
jgi:macrolide transport system ATP-binding/permease protein